MEHDTTIVPTKSQDKSDISSTEVAAAEPDTRQHLLVCPCCGKQTLNSPVQIGDQQLTDYMTCVMTGVPYWKQYNLYNNNIHVRAQIPNDAEASRMSHMLAKFRIANGLGTSSTFATMDYVLRSLCYIERIRIDRESAVSDDFFPAQHAKSLLRQIQTYHDTKDGAQDFCADILCRARSVQFVSALPSTILDQIIQTHNRLYAVLVRSAFDSNFWQGIRLA